MDKIGIERLLLDLFKENYRESKRYNYISQLAIITTKSLIPMMNEEAVRIDYTRFLEEFKLWLSYRVGENPSLLNAQGRVDPSIYWSEKDDSIIGRIIPIILANQKHEIIEEEIVKNILFTTGNLQIIFEAVSIAYLLYGLTSSPWETDLIDKLKENIIRFSQIDYMTKYEKNYRIKIEYYPHNFKVEFERERIHLLNTLNGIRNNRYPNLEDIIDVLEKKDPKAFIGKIVCSFLYNSDEEYEMPKFYMSLGEYIILLRKSRIEPERLKIKEYILPDIFSFNEGQVFFHSLLKEAKVIKKEVRDHTLTSLIQTKTGMYLFKR